MDPTKTPQQDNPENPNEDLSDKRQKKTAERRGEQRGPERPGHADRQDETPPHGASRP